jgi:hypothetical protein
MIRLGLLATVLLGAAGCCCCGTSGPPKNAGLRVLAGPDPAVVFVDGVQKTSLSAYSADDMRVRPGHHEVKLVIGAADVKIPLDVKAGDEMFLGASDKACFAVVEPPKGFADGRPIVVPPGPYALVKVLQPGEVWPEGEDLGHVSSFVTGISFSLTTRLVAPIDCAVKDDAAGRDAAIAASLGTMVQKAQ